MPRATLPEIPTTPDANSARARPHKVLKTAAMSLPGMQELALAAYRPWAQQNATAITRLQALTS